MIKARHKNIRASLLDKKRKEMKKKVAICILVVFALTLSFLVGCSGRAEQIINSVNYPDEYYIEYELTAEDNTVKTVAMGKDSYGNYYYNDGSLKRLYISSGNKLLVYERSGSAFLDTGTAVNEKYVQNNSEAFDELAKKSMERFIGSYERDDGDTVCERDCDVYTLSLKIVNFKQSYKMLVDCESGICMSWWGMTEVSSNKTGKTGFECVKFATENIDFSSYILEN